MRPERAIATFLSCAMLSVLLTACGGTTAGPSISPVGSAAAASAPASPAASSQGAGDAVAATTRNIEGPARFRTSQLTPTLTFTLPEHWTSGQAEHTFAGADESPTGLPLTNGVATVTVSVPTDLMPRAPGEAGTVPLPADLLAWLASDKDLSLGAPTDVTIGGIAGKQVDGRLSPTARIDPAEPFVRLTDYLLLDPRDEFRVAVLRVDGKQVVVATTAPADRWDEELAKAQPVIGSFSFTSS